MTGFIEKAIIEAKWEIPQEILDLVFLKKSYWDKDRARNLDREIIAKVISPKVLPDMSLSGGTDVIIPLLDVHRHTTEEFMAIYNIPKEFTGNRSIINILSIMYLNPYMVSSPASMSQCGWSNTMAASQAVMDAMSPIPNFTSAEVQLSGENVITVRDARVLPDRSYARCTLAYDAYMSDIHPRSYIALAYLVVLAIKAYVYRETRIYMDKGRLESGVEIGEFRATIEEYRDAAEMYRDYLKNTVRRVLHYNDPVKARRSVIKRIGGYR